MSIISTRKLLISLIIVMIVMILGITNEVECSEWETKINVMMNPGQNSERYVPTGSDNDSGSGTINKFLLHKREGNNIVDENLNSTYSDGVTSFLDGKIKLITKKVGKIHGFQIKLSQDIMDYGDEFRIEVDYMYIYPSGTVKTYKRNYDLTIKEPVFIYYDLNGGKGDIRNTKVNLDGTANLISKIPTKSGYIFEGWYYEGTKKTYDANYLFTGVTKNITVVAQWRKAAEVDVEIPGTDEDDKIPNKEPEKIPDKETNETPVTVGDLNKEDILKLVKGSWNLYSEKAATNPKNQIYAGDKVKILEIYDNNILKVKIEEVSEVSGLSVTYRVKEGATYYLKYTNLAKQYFKIEIEDEKEPENGEENIETNEKEPEKEEQETQGIFGIIELVKKGISFGESILGILIGNSEQTTEERPLFKLLNTFNGLIGGLMEDNGTVEDNNGEVAETTLEVEDILKFTAQSYYLYSDKETTQRIGKVLVTGDELKVLEINDNILKVEIKVAKNLEKGEMYYIKYIEKYFDIEKAEKQANGILGSFSNITNNNGQVGGISNLLTGGLKFLNTLGKGFSQMISNYQNSSSSNFLTVITRGAQTLGSLFK